MKESCSCFRRRCYISFARIFFSRTLSYLLKELSEEEAPEFVSLLSEYTEVQTAAQSDGDVSPESFADRDVIFVADVRQYLLLGKAIGWLLGTEQIVNESGPTPHSCWLITRIFVVGIRHSQPIDS